MMSRVLLYCTVDGKSIHWYESLYIGVGMKTAGTVYRLFSEDKLTSDLFLEILEPFQVLRVFRKHPACQAS